MDTFLISQNVTFYKSLGFSSKKEGTFMFNRVLKFKEYREMIKKHASAYDNFIWEFTDNFVDFMDKYEDKIEEIKNKRMKNELKKQQKKMEEHEKKWEKRRMKPGKPIKKEEKPKKTVLDPGLDCDENEETDIVMRMTTIISEKDKEIKNLKRECSAKDKKIKELEELVQKLQNTT
jgi:hypothetical protein